MKVSPRNTHLLMTKRWTLTAALSLFGWTGAGCDSLEPGDAVNSGQSARKVASVDVKKAAPGEAKERQAEAPSDGDAVPTTPGSSAADSAAIQKALGEHRRCIFECMDTPGAKETDREGCKLTCGSNAEAAGVDNDPRVGKIADRFELCTSECYAPKIKETDRETCKLNCTAVAESLESTLEFATPEPTQADSKTVARGCAGSCMQQMSKCERVCDSQEGVETDRETCRLLCTANGEICLDTCNIEAAKAH